MSDNSDRPFGHDTLKLHTVFVPEAVRHQISPGEITATLGHGAAKVGAVFTPDGGRAPSPPFLHVGRALFRPAPTAGGALPNRPAQPSARAEPEPENQVPAPPPVPALAHAQADPLRAGLAAWRGVSAPGAVPRALAARRIVNATARVPPAASDPSPAVPRND